MALALWATPAAAKIVDQVDLPLCEPSGVHALSGNRLLIVDDEQQREVFVMRLDQQGLSGPERLPIPRTKDLEAIAGVGDRVILVGSHSRRGDAACSVDGRRMRVVTGTVSGSALTAVQRISWLGEGKAASKRGDLVRARDTLFTNCAPADAKLCATVAAAEAAAPGDAQSCAEALNVEGAVAVGGALWLGLRAPRLGADAVMLQVGNAAQLDRLRLAGHARLDLGGRGVRGLTANATHVFGIAGPVGDAGSGGFSLFRFPVKALTPGARIVPTIVGGLPTKSEGLTLMGAQLVVVTDGESPSSGGACPTPGRLYLIELPAP